jgi:phage recombination protein Bet
MNELTTTSQELLFDPKNLTKDTIKKYLCPLATDQELTMGLQIAKTFGLNPLKREIYFVKYSSNSTMQVLTGYEVYIKRAERSGKYDGLEMTSEGRKEDGSLKAIVKVYRKDWKNPLIHEAYYCEYVQTKQDGTPNKFWATKPITMIKKVTVSQAFRLAFPDEFDGMPYTSDEVVDQEKIIDINAEPELKMPTAKNEVEIAPTMPLISTEMPQTDTIIEKTDNVVRETQSPQKTAKELKIDNNINTPIKETDGIKLLELLKTNGYTKQDLKEFIFFTFELDKLSQICYGHMDTINKEFSKPKEKK